MTPPRLAAALILATAAFATQAALKPGDAAPPFSADAALGGQQLRQRQLLDPRGQPAEGHRLVIAAADVERARGEAVLTGGGDVGGQLPVGQAFRFSS